MSYLLIRIILWISFSIVKFYSSFPCRVGQNIADDEEERNSSDMRQELGQRKVEQFGEIKGNKVAWRGKRRRWALTRERSRRGKWCKNSTVDLLKCQSVLTRLKYTMEIVVFFRMQVMQGSKSIWSNDNIKILGKRFQVKYRTVE